MTGFWSKVFTPRSSIIIVLLLGIISGVFPESFEAPLFLFAIIMTVFELSFDIFKAVKTIYKKKGDSKE